MEKVDSILDEYEISIGLGKLEIEKENPEIEKYLSMSRSQMEKLDIEGCAQAALILGGFSFYLQRVYNREIARANWAEGILKKLIAGKESQYKGSWDSQYYQAIKEDKYANGLYKIKQYAKQRVDRTTFLANSVKNMGDLFINLQRAKATK